MGMKITQEQMAEMLVMMDRDGDGVVNKVEFKTALLYLYPKTTDDEYDKIWKSIDDDGSGTLEQEELATYFGFKWDDLAKDLEDKKSMNEMSDDQILEALQMHQALRELEETSRINASPEQVRNKKTTGPRRSRDNEFPLELVKMPTKITANGNDAKIEFLQACEVGDEAEIKAALAKGVKVRIEDEKGEMPLHKMAKHGLKELSRLCLEESRKLDAEARRQDVNHQDKKNEAPPIFSAAAFKHAELTRAYVEWGADLTILNNNDQNILHIIVNTGDTELLKLFLTIERVVPQRQKLFAVKDKDGRTPMHVASMKNEDVVQILLNNGAKPNVEDNVGNTPADLAGKSGRRKSRDLLESATVDQQAQESRRKSMTAGA